MRIFVIIISLFVLLGCEEIIQLDINSTDPQIIIEAVVSNLPGDNLVAITKSTDFYNPNEYENIVGAEIVITDSKGNSYVLSQTSPGNYNNSQLKGNPGLTYTINVNFGDNNFTAVSNMPEMIQLDSVNYIAQKIPFRDEFRYEFHCFFQDRKGINDYAKFNVYKNSKKLNGLFLYDDRLTDGNYIDFFWFNFRDEKFNKGDVITFELLTIDLETYNYFDTLRGALARARGGPFGSTAPANPTSNWNNDAFGYFSAHTKSLQSIVLN